MQSNRKFKYVFTLYQLNRSIAIHNPSSLNYLSQAPRYNASQTGPPPVGPFLRPSRPHGSISRSCTQTDDNTEQISTQEQKISQHTSLQPHHHLNDKFYRKASHLKSDATTRAIDS